MRVLALSAALCAVLSTAAYAQTTCPGGPINLSMLIAEGNPPTPDVVAAWEKNNPCIKITTSEVPFSQLADKISVLSASANPPDILGYDGPDTQTYASLGVLLPLDKYISADLKNDILPATLAEHSYKGHIYSPGLEQVTLAMFYNADMTDKLGIHPPQTLDTAWTWPQAIEAFQKCQQGPADNPTVWGLGPTRFGNGQPGFVYRDLLFQRSAGDPKADPNSSLYKTFWALGRDGKTLDGWLNTPEAIAALHTYQDLFNKLKVAPKAGIPNAFIDRKACFYTDTSYLVGTLKHTDPGFKWGVTPMPYFKTPVVHTGSTTIGVSAKSKHPDEAAKFVIDISTGDYALQYAKTRGIIPTLKSLFPKMPELKQYPLSIFVDELTQWGQPRPPSPHFGQYEKLVTDALRDIAFGADPKTRMNAAVRALQPLMAR
jgi:ABC-type glycerol-3-phosphate transport system substrate-binding protein